MAAMAYRKGEDAMRRIVMVALIGMLVGLGGVGRVEAVTAVSPGLIGDALVFPLFDVNNLHTLIAIESATNRTDLHLVRFRDENGTSVLSFTLCLTPFSSWTADVYRDGSATKVVSGSTLMVNGSTIPLDTTLTGNPTRGFIEVIGLRQTTSAISDTAICTDSTLGEEVKNYALMGKAYFVNPSLSTILAYGTNAMAFKDFALTKITNGTVVANQAVANALILQGTQVAGFESSTFESRYFVDPAFGAETQMVMSFATGPTTGGCPGCRVPTTLHFMPVAEDGTVLAVFDRGTGGKHVNVFSITGGDIASPGGVLAVTDIGGLVVTPVTGFAVQTTSAPPPGQPFFNVLFPLAIK
jgi:hypothetical protein